MKRNTILLLIIYLVSIPVWIFGQNETEAGLLLDLKKTRADYEVAKQKFENDAKLYDEKAISLNDFNRSKNELLSKEVDYQKLILKLISQQSYVTVERAVKYQNERGDRKVKIQLKSALEGNEEYLNLFKEHFDIFSPEMSSGKVYNIYVSLMDNETKTIIGSPYEYHLSSIKMGETVTADFELLKDVESLTVSLNYNNRKDEKNIYLKKDAGTNTIDITSIQFSQEADIGSNTTYDLTLERFSTSEDVYKLMVLNLPDQITYDFTDNGSKVSQIRFSQGVNIKKLSLQLYLPDREDEKIVINKPIQFQVVALTGERSEKAAGNLNALSLEQMKLQTDGYEQLELIPRGKGKIEVRAANLYHEISSGNKVQTEIVVRNGGSRRLDNIRILTENPIGWETEIVPELVKSLEPEKETTVSITIIPPKEEVGAQEIKVKTEALADNQKVKTEDKTIRVQVNAKTSLIGTVALILVIVAFIGGIVWFGMKLSKK